MNLFDAMTEKCWLMESRWRSRTIERLREWYATPTAVEWRRQMAITSNPGFLRVLNAYTEASDLMMNKISVEEYYAILNCKEYTDEDKAKFTDIMSRELKRALP